MLLDDLVVSSCAAVSFVLLVTSFFLLVRHGSIVRDVRDATSLSRNIWEAMDSRFKKQDERIVDLMVKTDVFSVRVGSEQPVVREAPKVMPLPRGGRRTIMETGRVGTREVIMGEVEKTILRIVVDRSMTSNQIRDSIGKSREHTARMMKLLYEQGYVSRDDSKRPFVYSISDAGRTYLGIDFAGR